MKKRSVVVAVIVCLLAVSVNSCQHRKLGEEPAGSGQAESVTAANIESAKAFYRYLDAVNLDSCKALCRPDVKIFYQSSDSALLAEIEPLIKDFYAALPDYKHDIEDIFGADDKVVVRVVCSGTFAQPFKDIKPSGAKFRYKGIHLFQFADGKISNIWAVEDELGVMTQLGMKLKPARNYR